MNPPPLPPPLLSDTKTIRFTLSRWDVYKCRLSVLLHHKVLMTMSVVTSFVFPMLTFNSPEMANKSIAFRIFYVLFLSGVTFTSMLVINLVLQAFLVIATKNRGVVGNHEFEIRDDGLFERTDVNESLFKWAGFSRIRNTRNFLIVFVTDNNVQYIPFRCFASREHAERFREEITQRRNAARRGSSR